MKKNNLNHNAVIAETINKRLLIAAATDNANLLLEYQTTLDGYSEPMVEQMREQHGENLITHQASDSFAKRVVEAFINPFTLVLLALALISIMTDVVVVAPADRDFMSVSIVMLLVLISGVLRVVQETRSGKSAEKLNAMVKTTTAVQRESNGKVEIPLAEVVVGDIIHLAAGDMLPADVRILQAKDLFINQSIITHRRKRTAGKVRRSAPYRR